MQVNAQLSTHLSRSSAQLTSPFKSILHTIGLDCHATLRGAPKFKAREREKYNRLHSPLALHAPPHTLGCIVGARSSRLPQEGHARQPHALRRPPHADSAQPAIITKSHTRIPASITKSRARISKRLRGGLVLKAHRLLHHPTLGSRVIKNNKISNFVTHCRLRSVNHMRSNASETGTTCNVLRTFCLKVKPSSGLD